MADTKTTVAFIKYLVIQINNLRSLIICCNFELDDLTIYKFLYEIFMETIGFETITTVVRLNPVTPQMIQTYIENTEVMESSIKYAMPGDIGEIKIEWDEQAVLVTAREDCMSEVIFTLGYLVHHLDALMINAQREYDEQRANRIIIPTGNINTLLN